MQSTGFVCGPEDHLGFMMNELGFCQKAASVQWSQVAMHCSNLQVIHMQAFHQVARLQMGILDEVGRDQGDCLAIIACGKVIEALCQQTGICRNEPHQLS